MLERNSYGAARTVPMFTRLKPPGNVYFIFRAFSSSIENSVNRVVMMGPPGSGKGTYAARTSSALNIPTISTGDLLRNEISGGGKRSEYLNALVASGKFVGDDVVREILTDRLRAPDCKAGFILDGYPRTLIQVGTLDAIATPTKVVLLEMRKDIIMRKMAGRRLCSNCGAGYNLVPIHEPGIDMPAILPQIPGFCDKCNHALVQRADDHPDVMKRRLDLFEKESAPIVAEYERRGILVRFSSVGEINKRVHILLRILRGSLDADPLLLAEKSRH